MTLVPKTKKDFERQENLSPKEDFRKSMDNVRAFDQLQDISEGIEIQKIRKLSAPISISSSMQLNITKIGKEERERRSYYNKLISKGMLS